MGWALLLLAGLSKRTQSGSASFSLSLLSFLGGESPSVVSKNNSAAGGVWGPCRLLLFQIHLLPYGQDRLPGTCLTPLHEPSNSLFLFLPRKHRHCQLPAQPGPCHARGRWSPEPSPMPASCWEPEDAGATQESQGKAEAMLPGRW